MPAPRATGDTLLFLHADTRLPPVARGAIEAALRDPQVAGGGFALRFDEQGWLYWLIGWSTSLRSQARHAFTGDQAIFVRADAFRALGGYADIPLMEDIEFCRRLRVAASCTRTWSRRPAAIGGTARCACWSPAGSIRSFMRWACRSSGYIACTTGGFRIDTPRLHE
jgi:hypothetical protein